MTLGSCRCDTLRLYSSSGTATVSVVLPGGVAMALAAGSQGGYFVSGNLLMRVNTQGAVSQIGTVVTGTTAPAAPVQVGALSVSPGAESWAYVAVSGSAASPAEEVWVGGPGLRPRVVLNSSQDQPPASEFPSGFSYRLLGWVEGKLLVGLLGASSGFAPQYPEVLLVSPRGGSSSVVSNSSNCPVSAVGLTGEFACLQQGPGLASELVTGVDGFSGASWSLPQMSGYGSAAISPSGQLALTYCAGCGPSPSSAWAQGQIQLLDQSTGALTPLGPPGLISLAWLPGGELLAAQYSVPRYARSGTSPSSALVLVQSSTGAVTPLASAEGAQFVGLTGS